MMLFFSQLLTITNIILVPIEKETLFIKLLGMRL